MHQTKCNGKLPCFHFFETNVHFSTAIFYDVRHSMKGHKPGVGMKSKKSPIYAFQKIKMQLNRDDVI